MKIKKKVKKLSEVDSNLHPFYEEDAENEGFKLRTDQITATAISVISGQNAALAASRQEAKDAKDAGSVDLSALADYGTDPAGIAAAVTAKIEELSNAASTGQKDVAKRIDDIKKQHSEALVAATAEKDKEIAEQKTTLHNYMLNTAIMTAAGSWQGLNAKLVSPFALQHMQIAEVDGKARTVVVDSDNHPRYSKTPERAGELMQADELLVEMSEQADYKPLFPSQQAVTGGDMQPARTPLGVRRVDATAKMTPAQKIAHGLSKQK